LKKKQTKFISIVTPVFDEESNIENLIKDVSIIISDFNKKSTTNITYEHIVIDNQSQDNTKPILRKLAKNLPYLKVIFNLKNYGQHISPFYAVCQSSGDAVITLAGDFEDPIDLIPKLIKSWLCGNYVTCAVRKSSEYNYFSNLIRNIYYKQLDKLSSKINIQNFSGYGIFDKEVINRLKKLNEPNPYFRSLVVNFGYKINLIYYDKKNRSSGSSKNNLDTLIDTALLGIVTIGDYFPILILKINILIIFLFLLSLIIFVIDIISLNLFVYFSLFLTFIIGFVNLLCLLLIIHKFNQFDLKISNSNVVIEEERLNF